MNAESGKIKLFLFIGCLGGGGAERVAYYLLNHLSSSIYFKGLILFQKKGEYLNRLPETVVIHDLNIPIIPRYGLPSVSSLIKLCRILKAEKPDVVITFSLTANVLLLLARALSGTDFGIVATEHVQLSAYLRNDLLRPLKKILIRMLYPRLDLLVTVSAGIKSDLVDRFGIKEKKVVVIPNPLDIAEIEAQARLPKATEMGAENKGAVIVSVGRLTKQKNYPCALRTIKRLQNHIAQYLILGEGELRRELEDMVRSLGLQDKVKFLGYLENPFAIISSADIFLLTSFYEGFGLVIVEAMICRVPIVTTDCPSGPNEIVENGVDGFLVPVNDDEALANAIEKILSDTKLRKKFIEAGRKKAQQFSKENIIPRYEHVIRQVASKKLSLSKGNI